MDRFHTPTQKSLPSAPSATTPADAGDRFTPSAAPPSREMSQPLSTPAPHASPWRAASLGALAALTLLTSPLSVAAGALPSPTPHFPAQASPSVERVIPASPASSKAYSAKGTGYFPKHVGQEGGPNDMIGKPLHTLQAFLAGKAPYVSVAMDKQAGLPYGTKLRIPELEKKYGRPIEFRVVDTGSAFKGKGTSRIDICVRDFAASLEETLNGHLTLIHQPALAR